MREVALGLARVVGLHPHFLVDRPLLPGVVAPTEEDVVAAARTVVLEGHPHALAIGGDGGVDRVGDPLRIGLHAHRLVGPGLAPGVGVVQENVGVFAVPGIGPDHVDVLAGAGQRGEEAVVAARVIAGVEAGVALLEGFAIVRGDVGVDVGGAAPAVLPSHDHAAIGIAHDAGATRVGGPGLVGVHAHGGVAPDLAAVRGARQVDVVRAVHAVAPGHPGAVARGRHRRREADGLAFRVGVERDVLLLPAPAAIVGPLHVDVLVAELAVAFVFPDDVDVVARAGDGRVERISLAEAQQRVALKEGDAAIRRHVEPDGLLAVAIVLPHGEQDSRFLDAGLRRDAVDLLLRVVHAGVRSSGRASFGGTSQKTKKQALNHVRLVLKGAHANSEREQRQGCEPACTR